MVARLIIFSYFLLTLLLSPLIILCSDLLSINNTAISFPILSSVILANLFAPGPSNVILTDGLEFLSNPEDASTIFSPVKITFLFSKTG